MQSRDQSSINIPCKFKEHWKQRRLSNRASNITNFPPRFCVYKWASSLFTGIVSTFHMGGIPSKKSSRATLNNLPAWMKKVTSVSIVKNFVRLHFSLFFPHWYMYTFVPYGSPTICLYLKDVIFMKICNFHFIHFLKILLHNFK